MESYRFGSYDEAIDKLQAMKKNGRSTVIVFTIDLESNEEAKKTVVSTEEGCVLIRSSQTIIINEDTIIPHIQLYSTKQCDLENIIREGVMHDIIFRQ